jgi:hypothetical protein
MLVHLDGARGIFTYIGFEVEGCNFCTIFIAIVGQNDFGVVGCKDISASKERAWEDLGSSLSRPCYTSPREETRYQEYLHCPGMVKVCVLLLCYFLSVVRLCVKVSG